jgi:hypothetical protein
MQEHETWTWDLELPHAMDTAILDGAEEKPADICLNGDIILIVGEDCVRLRVDSQSLRSASKIFDAMFGPCWSEGQKLSRDLPTEVALPDDNAEAMWMICRVIHHRNDLAPKRPTARKVLQIAIAIDKYDLQAALIYAILEWLKPRRGQEMLDTGRLLAAAFLLDSSELFMAHSKILLLEYSESYLSLMKDESIRQVLPLEIYCM